MDTSLVILVFVAAGLVKGVSGMGLPTIAAALLGLATAPAEAVALIAAPAFFSNLLQMWRGPHLRGLTVRLWPLLIGACAGAALGGMLHMDAATARLILGEALLLYAMLGVLNFSPRMPPQLEPWLGPVVGMCNGILAASTGVLVVPSLPYLSALKLDRDAFVQALGLCFTVFSAAMAVPAIIHGSVTAPLLTASAAGCLGAFFGMNLGEKLRRRIPARPFRTGLNIFIFAVGVHLICR